MKFIFSTIFLYTSIFSQDHYQDDYKEFAQRQNIPQEIINTFRINHYDSIYTISFRINPLYLRGDFNGDKIIDYAVLIVRKSDLKNGIAIIHGNSNKVFILGAGKKFENWAIDDFHWFNAWNIFSKQPVYQNTTENPPPTLKGDALFIQEVESGSGLIYWNGKSYHWYQGAD